MASASSRLVAFASGKGGVGKTVCAANLALHLAEHRRVLTVDLDFGCGNLNTSLGVRTVSGSINDFLVSKVPTLGALKTATALGGLDLISCSYAPVDTTVLEVGQKSRLIEQLRADDSDYVLMDLGSGVNDDVLDLFAAADVRVLVTGPESLALHNAFVFVKSLTYRIIAGSLEQSGLSKRTRENIVKQLYDSGDQEIGRTIERVRMRDRNAANSMRQVLAGIQIHLILNKVQDASEERFVTNLQQLTRKYVEVELNYLGSVPYDDNVKRSLNDIVPFALEYKKSPANAAFREVASKLDCALSDVAGPEEEAEEPEVKPVTHRVASFLRGALGSGNGKPPESVRKDEPSHDQVAKIRRLVWELAELKRVHEREKQEWREEKDEINRHLEELRSRNEVSATRAGELQKLQESVRRKDELIEGLRSEAARQLRENREPRLQVEAQEPALQTAPKNDALRPLAPATVREQFLSSLLEHSWYRITIVQMEEGGSEASRYGAEIASVLGLAQWMTTSTSSSFKENQFTGLRIIHDNSPEAVDGASILGEALASAGIEHTIQKSAFPTEFERIRLVVGRSATGVSRTLRMPLPADMRYR